MVILVFSVCVDSEVVVSVVVSVVFLIMVCMVVFFG